MGRIKLDAINEFARHGYRVRITCSACGNTSDWSPIELMGLLQKRGISLSVDLIEQRMKCSSCGARQAIIRPALAEEG